MDGTAESLRRRRPLAEEGDASTSADRPGTIAWIVPQQPPTTPDDAEHLANEYEEPLKEESEEVDGRGEEVEGGELVGGEREEEGEVAEEEEGLLPILEKTLVKIEQKIEERIERITHWVWHVVPFDNLPGWLRDNEFLRHNHRPPMNSFRGCFKSIFRMHTETWNIWTHLLGFVFFLILCLGVYIFGDCITCLFEDIEVHNLPWDEQLVIFMFFIGAMACLCCSFLFHTLANHSQPIFYIFSRLDYSGIAFLITGSSIPAYYYGFYCMTLALCIHISILVVLCVLCVTLSLWSRFSHPKFRPLRFAMFIAFGLYGCIPVAHIIMVHGVDYGVEKLSGLTLVLMAILYIFGATLYVLRVPERFFPGWFDIWASSHQLFHLFVVMAALVHYDTILSMGKYRLSAGLCINEFPLGILTA